MAWTVTCNFNMYKTIFATILLPTLIMCQPKSNAKSADEKSEMQSKVQSRDSILFFHPTPEEFDSLIEKFGEASGLYEVDSDFGFYAKMVFDSLKNTSMTAVNMSGRYYKYLKNNQEVIFDRLDTSNHPYGYILALDGCEPSIEFGVMSHVGIFQFIKEEKENCR